MSSSLLLYVCCLFISPGQSHYGLHQQPIRFRVLSNFWPIRFRYMIEKTIKIYFHTNGKNTHKKIIIWFPFWFVPIVSRSESRGERNANKHSIGLIFASFTTQKDLFVIKDDGGSNRIFHILSAKKTKYNWQRNLCCWVKNFSYFQKSFQKYKSNFKKEML